MTNLSEPNADFRPDSTAPILTGHYALMPDWWPSEAESTFRKGGWASRIGKRRPWLGPLQAERFDVDRFRGIMRSGGSVLGVQFVGHLPKESALPIHLQLSDVEFPVASIGWLPICPGDYGLGLIRGGAIKAGGLHVAGGEICCLDFYFGAIGITFSYWDGLTALTLAEFERLQSSPIDLEPRLG